MQRIAIALLLFASLPIAVAADDTAPTVDDLAWMAGHWVGDDDARSEELWLPPAGGMLVGVHRDTRREDRVFYEYLRVETQPDGVYYVSKPSNQPEAAFRLVDADVAGRAVFENLEHDFPQRITYALEENVLTITIWGVVDGKERSSSWVMKPAPAPKETK